MVYLEPKGKIIVQDVLMLKLCLLCHFLAVFKRVSQLMELLAEEKFSHVLVKQISQAVFVQEFSLDFVDVTREHPYLTPFENANFEIILFLVPLEFLILSLQILNLHRLLSFVFFMLLFPLFLLFRHMGIVVDRHLGFLLCQQVLSRQLFLV